MLARGNGIYDAAVAYQQLQRFVEVIHFYLIGSHILQVLQLAQQKLQRLRGTLF